MGGNVWEWTTESRESSTSYPYMRRGGSCFSGFAGYPAGYRFDDSDRARGDSGFRLTLFL